MPTFEFVRVLRRTAGIVRFRWYEIVALTFALEWVPRHFLPVVLNSIYRSDARDLSGLILAAVASLALGLVTQFAAVAVMALALRDDDQSPWLSVRRVLQALPRLIPVWLLCDSDMALRLWTSSTRSLQRLPPTPNFLFELGLLVGLVELVLATSATAGFGVLYPVIINEGRDLAWSLARAWHLMRNARLKLACLLVVYGVASAAMAVPLTLLRLAHVGEGLVNIIAWATSVLLSLVQSLWCVTIAASYVELRGIWDAASRDRLAHTFG